MTDPVQKGLQALSAASVSHQQARRSCAPQGEKSMFTRQLVAAALLCALLPIHRPAEAGPSPDPGVVIEWNQLAQATIPASAGPLAMRYYAILHVAMFDAANSITESYTPFKTAVNAAPGASPEAAAAQAARDVLVALIPAQKKTYDAALRARLANLPPERVATGVIVGKVAANRTLKWRANDGIFGPPVPFALPQLPGMWQPAVPGGQPALTQLPTAVPFTMTSITQFLVPRHPEMTSERYARDFEEVRLIGARASTTRTATQTQTAQLFASVITGTNNFNIWNNVARDVVLAKKLSLTEAARLFAFLDTTMMDSLLSTQTGKFIYGLWRPVTAIPGADADLNPATTADPSWQPLLATPPYPSYPGNMAGLGACAAEALATGTGSDEFAISATWVGAPPNANVTRQYSSFWQLAQEQADSRIYGGLHYRFENEASQLACLKLVQHAYAKLMLKR
jgi:hypothetical protein